MDANWRLIQEPERVFRLRFLGVVVGDAKLTAPARWNAPPTEVNALRIKVVQTSSPDLAELITNAAVAEMTLGGFQGKLMIVYKEDAGGKIVFVPDKRA
jgi:hypothetical protein